MAEAELPSGNLLVGVEVCVVVVEALQSYLASRGVNRMAVPGRATMGGSAGVVEEVVVARWWLGAATMSATEAILPEAGSSLARVASVIRWESEIHLLQVW